MPRQHVKTKSLCVDQFRRLPGRCGFSIVYIRWWWVGVGVVGAGGGRPFWTVWR